MYLFQNYNHLVSLILIKKLISIFSIKRNNFFGNKINLFYSIFRFISAFLSFVCLSGSPLDLRWMIFEIGTICYDLQVDPCPEEAGRETASSLPASIFNDFITIKEDEKKHPRKLQVFQKIYFKLILAMVHEKKKNKKECTVTCLLFVFFFKYKYK